MGGSEVRLFFIFSKKLSRKVGSVFFQYLNMTQVTERWYVTLRIVTKVVSNRNDLNSVLTNSFTIFLGRNYKVIDFSILLSRFRYLSLRSSIFFLLSLISVFKDYV